MIKIHFYDEEVNYDDDTKYVEIERGVLYRQDVQGIMIGPRVIESSSGWLND